MSKDYMKYARLKVLIVDDGEVTRGLIRGVLAQLWITSVSEAGDGRAGLLELLRTRPDIVLCDIHMPLSGLEFLRRVRNVSIQEIAATPIIMLTSDSSHETVTAATELGVQGYLLKPVALHQLKARIDAIIEPSISQPAAE